MKRNLPCLLLAFILQYIPGRSIAQITQLTQGADVGGIVLNGRPVMLNLKNYSFLTTDGSATGTVEFTQKVTLDPDFIKQGVVLNDRLYFAGVNGEYGSELWTTDGTDAGTFMVKDIHQGASASSPKKLCILNNELYFFADDGIHGVELWKSDGTTEGTMLIKDINPGKDSCLNKDFVAVIEAYNNQVFFFANDGTHGLELWKTDGTTVGTLLVKDINPTGDSYYITQSYLVDDYSMKGEGKNIFFAADDGIHGQELWKSDGTDAGTVMLADIAIGNSANSSFPHDFLALNGKLYFVVNVNTYYYSDFWVTDGTAEGTKAVLSRNAENYPRLTDLRSAGIVGGKIIFAASWSKKEQASIWICDGTAEGSFWLSDRNAKPFILAMNCPNYLTKDNYKTNYKGKVYYWSDKRSYLEEKQLWVTDGTVGGTKMIKDLPGNTFQSIPGGFSDTIQAFYTEYALYFTSRNVLVKDKIEIWKTDGTPNGTIQVGDAKVLPITRVPLTFQYVYNNQLYFNCVDSSSDNVRFKNLYKLGETVKTLPLSLIEFKARLEKNTVLLTWRTSSEINSSHFSILQSTDGAVFKCIGKVTAAGSATNPQSYRFNDNNVLSVNADVLYYRLQMFDKDGRYKYSEIEPVRLKNLAPRVSVFPNPVANILNVAVKVGQVEDVYVSIIDIKGAVLFQKRASNPAPDFTIAIDVSQLPAGIYYLSLKTSKQNHSISFIKNQGG
ncbi:ELWxxDGT repeat protein [Foetidibacter luteolus]|uniref:ELWxxDGT repeat protein n=1 Tax=Foetidibacter luteolus TaxID=2608880 RepID=UPI00129B5763|nr:ELWxxDGT repeat protein [Foetidibacter luteolus]